MKIIIKEKDNIQIINKSKFIGILKKVYSKEEIINYLNDVKKEYPDATHICYAYIIDNNKKYNDDNEPLNTAGKPILEVLEKNALNYVLAIVVRYFGGIKLGSNGLIRAYTSTISNILKDNIKDLEYGYLIKIITDYHQNNTLNYLLKDSQIIEKKYDNNIEILAIVKKDILEKLINIHYQIIEKRII